MQREEREVLTDASMKPSTVDAHAVDCTHVTQSISSIPRLRKFFPSASSDELALAVRSFKRNQPLETVIATHKRQLPRLRQVPLPLHGSILIHHARIAEFQASA